MASEATRQIAWNISGLWVMYALMAPTLAIAAYGFWRRIRLWRVGRPAARFDRPRERLAHVIRHAGLQQRTLADRYTGLFHTMIYTGFIVLTIATTVVLIDHDFNIPIMRGPFYLVFQSLLVDLFGVLVLAGVAMAGYRRWAQRPKKLVYTDEATWLLIVIFVIALTGFLLEGWRIAATGDEWASWSPVGQLVATFFDPFMSDGTLRQVHEIGWWFHLLLTYGLIAWTPYTKLAHVITAPLAIYTASLDGRDRVLEPIDLSGAEPLGVGSIEQFTQKDLLDLDACTECGRCTDACPANAVGSSLSPRDIILDLRDLMHANTSTLLGAAGNPGRPVPVFDGTSAVNSATLFQCTTCAACVEACPVYIEQLPKIVDMRRHLVLEKATFPPELVEIFDNLEQSGDPYGHGPQQRATWAQGLSVPVLAEGADPQIEWLFWVGCQGAFDDQYRRVVRSFARVLNQAGVSYAILGSEERCSGDTARRTGNEWLYRELATKNIEAFRRYGVSKVVTTCPHCFNTLKNEYRDLGLELDVVHHTELLAHLIRDHRLDLAATVNGTVTYHDACYLARYNDVVDSPREVMVSLGATVAEPTRSGRDTFCCGAGGGMVWLDQHGERRMYDERADELMATNPDTVVTACPFCQGMISAGIDNQQGPETVDLAEYVERALLPLPVAQEPQVS